jgi:hypothetical protein
MQSYKGLPNITHQPLLEVLMKTHDNKYIMYVGNPNRIPHLHFLEFQIQNFIIVDTHPTRNLQFPNFVIRKIPNDLHHRLLHPVLNCIKLKGLRHNKNNLSFIKQPSTPLVVLPSNATRYYNLSKIVMHTTPTK